MTEVRWEKHEIAQKGLEGFLSPFNTLIYCHFPVHLSLFFLPRSVSPSELTYFYREAEGEEEIFLSDKLHYVPQAVLFGWFAVT